MSYWRPAYWHLCSTEGLRRGATQPAAYGGRGPAAQAAPAYEPYGHACAHNDVGDDGSRADENREVSYWWSSPHPGPFLHWKLQSDQPLGYRYDYLFDVALRDARTGAWEWAPVARERLCTDPDKDPPYRGCWMWGVFEVPPGYGVLAVRGRGVQDRAYVGRVCHKFTAAAADPDPDPAGEDPADGGGDGGRGGGPGPAPPVGGGGAFDLNAWLRENKAAVIAGGVGLGVLLLALTAGGGAASGSGGRGGFVPRYGGGLVVNVRK